MARSQAPPSIVCSDSLAVAEALIESLSLRGALAVRLEPTGRRLRARLRRTSPGLVIVASSHAEQAVAAIGLSKRQRPRAKVIAVGLPNRELSVLRSFEAGADGVVLPEEPLAHVKGAVAQVLAGRMRPPPSSGRLAGRLVAVGTAAAARREERRDLAFARISAREREVLRCLSEGATNKEIALRLRIEVQTVKNYVTRLLHKLRVQNRYDAVRVASDLEAAS
jgi:DNA-binding NarL/FixJ family response regulator